MTLLVALKGNDGLVLAADSRGTFGDPRGVTAQNDSQQKAHILAPHVALLMAGQGEVGMMVIDEVKRSVSESGIDGATPVLAALRQIVQARYNEWFPTVPAVQPAALVQAGQVATRPEISFLVAGYEADGQARIFSTPSGLNFPPMLHDYGFAVSGVAQYALYLLNRLFQPDRTVEELTALAIYAITETASQDGKVGGPVNVITIKPSEEGCRAVAADEVLKIQSTNETRSTALRDSFFAGNV